MNTEIYRDISNRCNGDIYIGVVGPVRTGKSTFIKQFMDNLVIPNINDTFRKERAKDELPQSAAGRTIMTTEPKFIPEDAVELSFENNVSFKVRMIDCVGYIVPSSEGYIEDDQPRMVMTPWSDEEIPFNLAAEIGTKKVIEEHSTIGLVVTTDGTISNIPREVYNDAEARVINELKAINKPFVIIVNSTNPHSEECINLCAELSKEYCNTVLPVNCKELDESNINDIISKLLYEFPIKSINIDFSNWFKCLDETDELRKVVVEQITSSAKCISTINTIDNFVEDIKSLDVVNYASISNIDLSKGIIDVNIDTDNSYFYDRLSKKCGIEISNDKDLMNEIIELVEIKSKYSRISAALNQVEQTGYGIVMPTLDELSLEEPEIMKQGGKYGVRLKAYAPSIHMIKCNTYTEVAPIVGSESQSEELVMYLLKEFENNPAEI